MYVIFNFNWIEIDTTWNFRTEEFGAGVLISGSLATRKYNILYKSLVQIIIIKLLNYSIKICTQIDKTVLFKINEEFFRSKQ